MKKWKMCMGFVLLIMLLSEFASATTVTIRYENWIKDEHDNLEVDKWVNSTVVHKVFEHVGRYESQGYYRLDWNECLHIYSI